MGAQSFRDLIVWQKAHCLALEIYKITANFPDCERFGLISQMRRCAISIPSNIAEGLKRRGKHKMVFYNYSESSLEELKYQLLLSLDLNYIKNNQYDPVIGLCDEIGKILNNWFKAL